MSSIDSKLARIVLSLSLLLFLAACASPSPPSRFYRLESPVTLTRMPQSVLGGELLPVVGVGPIRLAGYLDRPQIIEGQGTHRLKLHEFDRWAGTLQENALQVLSDVMQDELPQAQVLPYPWHSRVEPDYEVVLNISRLERQGNRVVLRARWTLLGQGREQQIALGGEGFEASLAGSDMSAMAAAASQVLSQLARRIASELSPLVAPQR